MARRHLSIPREVCYWEIEHGRTCRSFQRQTLRIPNLNWTDEDKSTDEISRIEARIEELAEIAERCRKFILASKIAIAGGASLLLVMMLGLFGSNQAAAIGSIAVILGGIVSLGSNFSTLQQTMDAANTAEALRSDLISRIDLRVVEDGLVKLN